MRESLSPRCSISILPAQTRAISGHAANRLTQKNACALASRWSGQTVDGCALCAPVLGRQARSSMNTAPRPRGSNPAGQTVSRSKIAPVTSVSLREAPSSFAAIRFAPARCAFSSFAWLRKAPQNCAPSKCAPRNLSIPDAHSKTPRRANPCYEDRICRGCRNPCPWAEDCAPPYRSIRNTANIPMARQRPNVT
jgi:hypothetical protein